MTSPEVRHRWSRLHLRPGAPADPALISFKLVQSPTFTSNWDFPFNHLHCGLGIMWTTRFTLSHCLPPRGPHLVACTRPHMTSHGPLRYQMAPPLVHRKVVAGHHRLSCFSPKRQRPPAVRLNERVHDSLLAILLLILGLSVDISPSFWNPSPQLCLSKPGN